jgi:hypothetical protein
MALCAGLALAASGCLLITSLSGLTDDGESRGPGDGSPFVTDDGSARDGAVGEDGVADGSTADGALADASLADGTVKDGSVVPDAGGPIAVSFTLIDTSQVAQNGAAVAGFDPIVEGAVINRGLTGSSLSLRVNTSPTTVGSVSMVRNGGSPFVESAAPYALCGDDAAGHWSACSWAVGANTVVATAYDAPGAVGSSGPPLTLHFTLK